MSDTPAQEPTMEEILASIRRIISEDDAPAAESGHAPEAPAAAPPVAHEPPPAIHAEPHHEPEPHHESEEVLELTQRVEPPARAPEPAPYVPPPASDHTLGDLDVFSAAEIEPPAPPPRKPEPAPEAPAWHAAGAEIDEETPLIADHKADAAAGHFGALAQSLAMPAPGRSLEDVVRELLRPLLKEWLDQNLQQIVEVRVQAEVERISRRRVY